MLMREKMEVEDDTQSNTSQDQFLYPRRLPSTFSPEGSFDSPCEEDQPLDFSKKHLSKVQAPKNLMNRYSVENLITRSVDRQQSEATNVPARTRYILPESAHVDRDSASSCLPAGDGKPPLHIPLNHSLVTMPRGYSPILPESIRRNFSFESIGSPNLRNPRDIGEASTCGPSLMPTSAQTEVYRRVNLPEMPYVHTQIEAATRPAPLPTFIPMPGMASPIMGPFYREARLGVSPNYGGRNLYEILEPYNSHRGLESSERTNNDLDRKSSKLRPFKALESELLNCQVPEEYQEYGIHRSYSEMKNSMPSPREEPVPKDETRSRDDPGLQTQESKPESTGSPLNSDQSKMDGESSNEGITSSNTTPPLDTTARRRKGQRLPEELKDAAYREKRMKNNIAAKKSRDSRREKEDNIAIRAKYFKDQVISLQAELMHVERQLSEYQKRQTALVEENGKLMAQNVALEKYAQIASAVTKQCGNCETRIKQNSTTY